MNTIQTNTGGALVANGNNGMKFIYFFFFDRNFYVLVEELHVNQVKISTLNGLCDDNDIDAIVFLIDTNNPRIFPQAKTDFKVPIAPFLI